MKMTNKNTVLALKILMHVMQDFVNVFVSLYFLQVNEGNLLKLVIYNLTFCIMIPVLFLLTGKLCKSGKLLWVLRSGLIMALAYFVTMLVMGERMPDYYILMGVIYGIKEGLYWAAFNIMEYEGVENSQRRSLNGTYLVAKNLASILFPILMGSMIQTGSFAAGVSVMTVFTGAGFLISLTYNNTKTENTGQFQPFKMFRKLMHDKNVLGVCIYHVFTGMIYSCGAFKLLATIYILRMCEDSFTAGWVTALGSLVTMIFGFLFAKVLNTGRQMTVVNTGTSLFMALSTVIMLFHPAPWTVMLFYFVFSVYKDIELSIDAVLCNNVANLSDVVKANKSEYSLLCEIWLVSGRTIGFLLLAGYAVSNSNVFPFLFLPALAGICISFNRMLKRVPVK